MNTQNFGYVLNASDVLRKHVNKLDTKRLPLEKQQEKAWQAGDEQTADNLLRQCAYMLQTVKDYLYLMFLEKEEKKTKKPKIGKMVGRDKIVVGYNVKAIEAAAKLLEKTS